MEKFIVVVIILGVLLLSVLLPAVYIIVKKHFSQVDPNVREDIREEPTTERMGFIQENSPPSFDASAVLSAEPLGAGATGENSSVRVSFGLVVFYIKNVSCKSR